MVPRVLEGLRSEHRTMRKLLEMLKRQIELVADDRQPNGELLLEITEYFRCYPELFHNPKEELVLRYVIARNPAAADLPSQLEAFQERANREFGRFSRAVVRLLIEPAAAQDRFLSAALAFVESESQLVAWEDDRLFSLAELSLGEKDWSDIEISLSGLDGPVRDTADLTRLGRIGRAVDTWRSHAAA